MSLKPSRFMKDFAKRAGLSEDNASRIKDAFVQALRYEAMNGKQVIIHGLGTFYKNRKNARKHRVPFLDSDKNSITGEYANKATVDTKPYDYLAFRASSCNRKYESDQLELNLPGDTTHGDE